MASEVLPSAKQFRLGPKNRRRDYPRVSKSFILNEVIAPRDSSKNFAIQKLIGVK